MNIKILLACTALLALASVALADQSVTHDAATNTYVTTRTPGSVPVVPPRELFPSFEPMPAPRSPCDPMIITATPVPAAQFSSFARMPDTRRPTVVCGPVAVVRQAPAYVPPPPPKPPAPAPAPAPYVEPLVLPPELPHTASLLPLIGLLGLLLIGGAGIVRIGRGFAG